MARRALAASVQQCLQEAIGEYRADMGATLDRNASAVLERLGGSDRAAGAIRAMTTDPRLIRRIIRICTDCELHCRMFNQDVTTERTMPARLDALAASVKELDHFVQELDSGPAHRLSAYVALECGEAEYLRVALGRLAGLIEGRRRIAAETPLRMGATKKVSEGDETAAIGWLAEGIEAATGRPHYQHVATLADVVLRTKDISADRVREALRTRRGRDWRQG